MIFQQHGFLRGESVRGPQNHSCKFKNDFIFNQKRELKHLEKLNSCSSLIERKDYFLPLIKDDYSTLLADDLKTIKTHFDGLKLKNKELGLENLLLKHDENHKSQLLGLKLNIENIELKDSILR